MVLSRLNVVLCASLLSEGLCCTSACGRLSLGDMAENLQKLTTPLPRGRGRLEPMERKPVCIIAILPFRLRLRDMKARVCGARRDPALHIGLHIFTNYERLI